MALTSGTCFGAYEITALIGVGGMGSVPGDGYQPASGHIVATSRST